MTAPQNQTAASQRRAIHMPGRTRPPLAAVLRRIGMAVGLVFFVALVVRVGNDGYVDVTGEPIGILDALYYASVTVTTTGYGDITAISSGARLATIVLITPARILFLILVVGTTVEVLTEQSRQLILTRRWRRRVNNHYVICGFGATGTSAANDLVSRGIAADQIVAVDASAEAVADATERGFVAIHGDASRQSVLHEANVKHAKAVIVTPNRDDTSVLITLTARELNPTAHIVAGARHQENLHLLRQGGANEVIDATAAVGRMLGLGTYAPGAVRAFDDLLDSSAGLEIAEVNPDMSDGQAKVPDGSMLMVVLRDGRSIRGDELDAMRHDDLLIVLRDS
ncbi:MAG: potassium channel family protein [Acidimicrobiales bacterium]